MPETAQQPARRSTRIRAQIPFRLTGRDPALELSEHCHTLIVNTQGCGVRLPRPLEPGAQVILDELPIGTRVTGRVANCVPLGTERKYWLVGLALDEPANIWCIHPAPPDWECATKAVAAAASVAAPAKKGEWPFSQFSNKGEFHPGRK